MESTGGTSQSSTGNPVKDSTVLIVDDEPQLVGMYSAMLEGRYSVVTATTGERALERLSEAIDVVLLDRRMPGISGDDLARDIRKQGHEIRIALVTAVEPEIDVLEVPFDAYIVKPVRKKDLKQVVHHLCQRKRYSTDVQELLTVSAKLAAIESGNTTDQLDRLEEYQQLKEHRDQLLNETRERLDEVLEWDEQSQVFRDLLGSITR